MPLRIIATMTTEQTAQSRVEGASTSIPCGSCYDYYDHYYHSSMMNTLCWHGGQLWTVASNNDDAAFRKQWWCPRFTFLKKQDTTKVINYVIIITNECRKVSVGKKKLFASFLPKLSWRSYCFVYFATILWLYWVSGRSWPKSRLDFEFIVRFTT